jgi:hypothetical protein
MTRIESQPIDRREFIKRLAVVTVAVQIVPLAQACSALDETTAASGDSLMVTSTPGLFGHVHELGVLMELLENPPSQGASVETTRALLHRHSIRLSAEELLSIGAGGSVTKTMSSHRITICLSCLS